LWLYYYYFTLQIAFIMLNWIGYKTEISSYPAPDGSKNRKQMFDNGVLHRMECKRVIAWTIRNTSEFDTVNNIAPAVIVNDSIQLLVGESYSVGSPGFPFYDTAQYFVKVDNNGATTTPQYEISIQFIDEKES